MTWVWRCLTSSGEELTMAGGVFPTQGEAEAWIGESWQELLAAGVESVVLLEGDREVYGPMSLRPVD